MLKTNKNNTIIICVMVSLYLCFPGMSMAVEIEFSGQASGWITEYHTEAESWETTAGLRYIPQWMVSHDINDESFMDAELSLNCYLAHEGNSNNNSDDELNKDIKLYRAKLRYATSQTETRIGLQKINFGPAKLLRSLRWFDKIDPADPLKLTEGVYGLRFKYDALNNSSFWAWGLYGNEDTKGYEIYPTAEKTPEFGGRYETPLFDGEAALSSHFRTVDGESLSTDDFPEYRFGIDGQWDIIIGFWFESALIYAEKEAIEYNYTKMNTVGLDYTFDIGNGIYFILEHMATGLSEDITGWEEDAHVSAYSASYSLGLLDSISAMGFYDWERSGYHQYLTWQRTYDYWQFNFTLFYHPDNGESGQMSGPGGSEEGYGGRIMVVFNH